MLNQSDSGSSIAGANESPFVSVNQHPVVLENTTFVVDVDATDPEGDDLAFSIGLDATTGEPILDGALFQIDADTGVLEFRVAPDYEADIRPDSQSGSLALEYTVFVDVSDGTNTVTRAVWLTVEDVPEENGSAPRIINLPDGVLEIPEGQRLVYQLGAYDADGDKLLFQQTGNSPLRVTADGQIQQFGGGITSGDSFVLAVQVTDGFRTDDAEIRRNIVDALATGSNTGIITEELTISENEQLQFDVSSFVNPGDAMNSVSELWGEQIIRRLREMSCHYLFTTR